MGDRTQGNFEVVGGSPALREAMAEVWRRYGHLGSGNDDPDAVLHGEEWVDELSCGFSDDMQDDVEAVLGNTDPSEWPERIEIIEDAVYEWSGDLWRWQPALGWHHKSLTNAGVTDIDEDWLRARLDEAVSVSSWTGDAIDWLRGQLDSLTGKAWDPKWTVAELIPGALPGEPATRPIRRCHSQAEAEAYVARLHGVEDGRYVIDGPSED